MTGIRVMPINVTLYVQELETLLLGTYEQLWNEEIEWNQCIFQRLIDRYTRDLEALDPNSPLLERYNPNIIHYE